MMRPIVIGLGGPSSSGKSSIARILVDTLPNALLLQQDDFYKTDSDIPFTNGVQNWDCEGALNTNAFVSAIVYVLSNWTSPPGHQLQPARSDSETPKSVHLTAEHVASLRKKVRTEFGDAEGQRFLILDGFLLFNNPDVYLKMDISFLLRTSFKEVERRRRERGDYATIEGYWADPPGYVEKIVWPEYVEAHKEFFEGGDVEGEPSQNEMRVSEFTPQKDMDLPSLADWVVDVILERTAAIENCRKTSSS